MEKRRHGENILTYQLKKQVKRAIQDITFRGLLLQNMEFLIQQMKENYKQEVAKYYAGKQFVKQNIKNAPEADSIHSKSQRDIWKKRDNYMTHAISKKGKLDLSYRSTSQDFVRRWEHFRERRDAQVDEYVHYRSQQLKSRVFISHVHAFNMIKVLAFHFTAYKSKITRQMKIRFLIFRLQQKISQRNNKKFGSFQNKLRNNLRYHLTNLGMQSRAAIKERTKRILIPFVLEYNYRQMIIQKFYKLTKQLYYIQMKFIRQMNMKKGKLESLILYWD